MTTENIDIRIEAQEGGAVAAFKRLRSEVINNEKGLANAAKQGKMTGKSLRDISSAAGPMFGELGGRIDQVSDALKNFHGAGMLAKASLVGLVATGSWQVGTMLGEFIAQTEAWGKANAETIKGITADFNKLSKMQNEQFENEIKLANLAATKEQRNAELSTIRMTKTNELAEARLWLVRQEQDLNVALANDFLGRNTEDNAAAREGVKIAQERVKALESEFEIVDRMRYGGSEIEEQIAARQRDVEALKTQTVEKEKQAAQQAAAAAAEARAAEAQQRKDQSLLNGLQAQIIALQDGEEAAMRFRMELQEIGPDAIKTAITMQRQIDEMRTAAMDSAKGSDSTKPTQPGQLQAQQQRFITRGSGMSLEKQMADNTKSTAKTVSELQATQSRMAAAASRHFAFVERQLTE